MTDRAKDLWAAAGGIDPASLQAAKSAVADCCQEYLRWADLFSRRLESLPDEQLHKFARGLALTMLGHLPTRPATCPFCIQYGQDRSCKGCGYAATHGRCDADTSAFSIFIEAFQELGRAVYQDTGNMSSPPHEARQILYSCLQASCDATRLMVEDLASAGTQRLMEIKARHIGTMVDIIPVQLLSQEVAVKAQTVKRSLHDYW